MKKLLVVVILFCNISMSYANDFEIYKEVINISNSIITREPAISSILRTVAIEFGANRHKAYFKVEGIPNMHAINSTDGFSITYGYYLIKHTKDITYTRHYTIDVLFVDENTPHLYCKTVDTASNSTKEKIVHKSNCDELMTYIEAFK